MNINRMMTLWVAVFAATFFIFVFFYQRHVHALAVSQITNHARIVASSLWTFEKPSPTAYLALAATANGYRDVVVRDDRGKIFLEIKGPPPTKLEAFLDSLHLIPTYHLQSAVLYEGNPIGTISANWPCRAIYVYSYIVFCGLLLLAGIGLYLKLLDAKRSLETRVQERTAELEKEINERKRAEEELRSHTQRLTLHVMNTPLAVIEWNLDFRVLEWNKAAERIFEYTREEALGRTAYELIVGDDELEKVKGVWDHLIAQTGGTRSVNENHTKSGKAKICDWYNTILTNQDGSVIGIASLVLDTTERVQAEQEKQILEAQLLQAQKMEAIGALAGGIAHDFNNVLQTISGYTQLLLIDCAQQDEYRSRLQGIEKASKRATELIRQLLTFSRKIESDLRPINLNHEIEQTREMLERTIPKMIAIELDLDRKLYDIHGDPVQIEQIILNLGINAMHAMPDGGRLTIETANVVLDKAFCRSHLGATEGPNVVLTISDTGIGMDQETLSRIYEPFFSTKGTGQGTGLGLSNVYGITKNHQAYIECRSEPGEGTRFRIYFPATHAESDLKNEEQPQEILPTGTETILLIDDEEAIREIGAGIFMKFGYTTLTAANGEEGLNLYTDRKESIDLIVLDLNMPGMGGYKCLQAFKELDPDIQILIASGYTPAETIQQTIHAGASGFVGKPFQLADMIKKVRATLDEKQMARRASREARR
jgi:PAS domain S-box-containing protein